MKSVVEDENGLSEVLELVPTAAIDAQELVGRMEQMKTEQYWDECSGM